MKFMVVGKVVSDEEKCPLVFDDITEWVEQFFYLRSLISDDGRSLISDDGRVSAEVERKIANTSNAFGALQPVVFKNYQLSIETKQLLCSSECWTPLCGQLVNSFHHRCVRSVLGITNQQQWEQKISSGAVRAMWDDLESISTKLRKRRLEWLGHVVRMPSH